MSEIHMYNTMQLLSQILYQEIFNCHNDLQNKLF